MCCTLLKISACLLAYFVMLFLQIAPLEGQSTSQASDSELAKQTFSSCAACHGLDGRGGEHAPNIATDPKVQQLPDAAILQIIRNGIPAAGMPGFSRLLNTTQIGAVLKYLRVLQGKTESTKMAGDSNRGRTLFFGRAGCAECHMLNGRGGFLAADLSGYGSGHSASDIREWIIAPDRNLDPRHGTVTVLTRAGKKYRGVVRNEDNFSLQMQTADGSFHLINKSDLAGLDHESTSWMPPDYGKTLTPSQIDDLVSYLSQAGGEKPNSDQENN